MSIQVNNIDEFDMKKLVKECPKKVQQYVKSLNDFIENSGNLRDKQTRIIRQQATEIKNLLLALKDNHNLLIDSSKNNFQTHHITRFMGNEHIFEFYDKKDS
jgi:hypothetical protein